jgi:hypothetical protein
MPQIKGGLLEVMLIVYGLFASAYILLRVQIAFAISDSKTLRAFSTSCASSFTVFSVLIADSISRTGDADLADHQHQIKNPTSCEAGFFIWYQWPDSNNTPQALVLLTFMNYTIRVWQELWQE